MKFSKEEKDQLLEEWRMSSKSAWAYAKEKGLCPQTFNRWVRPKKRSKNRFVELPKKMLSSIANGKTIVIENVGDSFLADYITRKNYSIQRQRQIKITLRRLNELANGKNYKLMKQLPETPSPSHFAELLEAYLKFCKSIGNKENTITTKRRFCREFLCVIADAGCKNICDINTKYICKAILMANDKDSYAVIRSFLRYLYENGTIKNNLSAVIP